MNAPKSVMFLTTPSNTWPFSNLLMISARCASISLSINALCDTTAFLIVSLILTTLNSIVFPTN